MPKKKYEYERVYFMFNDKEYEAYGKTLKEAHAKAAKKKLALENGDVGISGDMAVKKWADEWLETYKRSTNGEAQYKNYKLFIGIICAAIGNKRLKDVTDVDLQKILNCKTGKSKSYIYQLNITIKAIFKRAYMSKLIKYNPAEFIEKPAGKAGKRRSITDYERKYILFLADTHHAGLWIKVMLYCGLRPAETMALDWRHIDFNKKLIHVEQAVKAKSKEIGDTKSLAGERYISIPDVIFNQLLSAKKSPFDPVFTQKTTGRRHTHTSIAGLWKNFKRHLDILMGAKVHRNQIILSVVASDLVAYCLRHTYATDLQDAGVPINIAKYLLGHSDIKVTANIYTDTTQKSLDDAAARYNDFLNKRAKTIL